MISRKKWSIHGKPLKIRYVKKGVWITVSGILKTDSFKTKATLDCWVSNIIKTKSFNPYKRFKASGIIIFDEGTCHFVAERFLIL